MYLSDYIDTTSMASFHNGRRRSTPPGQGKMTNHLLITIDTEIDKSKDWKVSSNESFSSVTTGVPDKLGKLFSRYGAKPTYLLSPEVIRNDACVSTLKTIKDCELGTHLHGDMIDPNGHEGPMANMTTDAMQSSYIYEIERQKMVNLTNLFVSRFNIKPISFRAGRFAAGTNTFKILNELGYKVDSSITPNVDWNYKEGRGNFLNAPDQPYYPKDDDILSPNGHDVLEIPVSIVSPIERKKWHNSALHNITDQLYRPEWLCPSYNTGPGMVDVIKRVTEQNTNKKDVTLTMMFHSMEIMPGASPYAATEKDCQRILENIEHVLAYAKDNRFRFSTLGEMPHYFHKIPRIVAAYDKDGKSLPLKH